MIINQIVFIILTLSLFRLVNKIQSTHWMLGPLHCLVREVWFTTVLSNSYVIVIAWNSAKFHHLRQFFICIGAYANQRLFCSIPGTHGHLPPRSIVKHIALREVSYKWPWVPGIVHWGQHVPIQVIQVGVQPVPIQVGAQPVSIQVQRHKKILFIVKKLIFSNNPNNFADSKLKIDTHNANRGVDVHGISVSI